MAHLVVGTAGHIDHGKSTLVAALTGTDPDRLAEEKARGITIELGFAHAEIGGRTVAFVDVPGHERFVRTMLAGAGGIDAVLLVVAADESVMPQTREHFAICRLLRVRQGVVALTKADLVDEETLELARLEVSDLLAGSFLDAAPVVPVSARTGVGIEALRTAIAGLGAAAAPRPADGPPRLPIDRVFTMQGFGTVVTGTLVSGRIGIDDELVLVPGGRKVRVRGIQVHGRTHDVAQAGQRTALNLGGIDLADVERGQTVAAPGSLVETRRADVLIDVLPDARPLRHGARVRVHQGTREALGRVSIAGADRRTIEPGDRAAARLRLESPLALTRGDRFILRAYSPLATIGGGVILDPAPPRAGGRTAAGLVRADALAPDRGERGEQDAVARMIAEAGAAGLSRTALVPRAGVAPGRVAAMVAALEADGAAVVAGERLVVPGAIVRLGEQLVAGVTEYHRSYPLSRGLPREEARARTFRGADPAVFELVLARLSAAGTLITREWLALASHRLDLSDEEARVKTAIEEVYRAARLTPPDGVTAAAAVAAPSAVADKLTGLLVRNKTLVRLDAQAYHADVLAELKADIQALKDSAPGGRATVDVAAFKARYGISRKFAIPLLEWLDRERVTRRMGDVRVVL